MPNLFRLLPTVGVLLGAALSAHADALSPHPEWSNLAAGKAVQFALEPNDGDVKDDGDATQLTDGVLSSSEPIWYDRQERLPVGWTGPTPIEFQVDLGEISPVRGVALRVGAGKNGVAWPKEVKVYVSDDGQKFSPLVDLMKATPNPPAPDAYSTMWLEANDLKTHGRYVKLVVQPQDSGNGTYFYTDELEIYRGEDAWVSLPLPDPEKPANPNSPRPQWQNLASGAEVAFNSEPNDASVSDIDDAKQLVDAVLSGATPIWADKSTVGWMGEKMVEFTVDLGKDQPIRGVALHMAAGQAGVEWPTNIEVYVSDTGSDFTPMGDLIQLSETKPAQGEYAAAWLTADKLETHGRFVKFVISPTNLGNGAYVFVDEVEVYRGEDAWLSKALAGVPRPEQWLADWKQVSWKEAISSVPEPERPRPIIVIDGKTETGAKAVLQQVEASDRGVTFSLVGEAGKPRGMSWLARLPSPISAENCRYVALTFKAEGIRRTYAPKPIVSLQGMSREPGGNDIAILEANMPLNDGMSHTIVRKLPDGFVLQQLAASVVTENDSARLTLERLEFLKDAPAIFNPAITTGGNMPKGFVPVNLEKQANGSASAWFQSALDRHKTLQDGVSVLEAGVLTASGAPFVMGTPGRNLVVMPESKPTDERVVFLGKEIDKAVLDPVSRHDQLAIEVDGQAREVLLLLAMSSPLTQIRGGIPPTALKLDDQESLMVELTYEDGESVLAFPYSMADKSCYIPAKELNAYAVAADPSRRLKKVSLHNRHFGPAFAVAGLTLNSSEQALVPQLANIPANEKTKENAEPTAAPLTIKLQGNNRLVVANRWYQYEFDLAQGFALDRVINRWNPSASIRLAPSSGLRLRIGDTIYTGRSFRAAVTRQTPEAVDVKLTSLRPELPLELTVTISGNESEELSFVTTGRNTGSEPLVAELSLPAVAGLTLGEIADTRVFFPQYRTVDTAETIALRAPYGPEFAVQFMDVYNRKLGVGLMMRTDNASQRMLDFSMQKNAAGVSAGVCFPASYNQIAPGSAHEFPKVSLLAHGGDWSNSMQLYTNWVRSWYKPHHSQDKAFFVNAWNLMCYRTSNRVSWNDARVPPAIEADRSKWNMDELLAFEEKRLGQLPDFIHFFNWTYNDKKEQNEYGVFGTPLAYEQVGGIDFFKNGIAEIQNKWKRPVSLYTMHDRIRISSVPDEKLVENLVAHSHHKELDTNDQSNIVRAGNSVDGIVFLQPGNTEWIDFVINDLVRMQKDTNCQLVYIDVFPSFSQLKGFNGASPRDADMMVIKRLRDELPPSVVIWTEYPLTDVASQYADGCLQYYFMDVSEVFARRYNLPDTAPDLISEMPFNVQRFATPGYKTIGLPTYIETGSKPSQVDATFFNGEAFQEDTYRLHHSRIRERLNRSYAVKKEYTDCFNSPNPVPRVYTPVGGMYVNLFPGNNRKLWTFYNGRPQTYSGQVLEIPHREGAKYRDAWHGRELTPVIENGMAKIVLTIDPQQMGCVVQDWNEPAPAVAQTGAVKQ